MQLALKFKWQPYSRSPFIRIAEVDGRSGSLSLYYADFTRYFMHRGSFKHSKL